MNKPLEVHKYFYGDGSERCRVDISLWPDSIMVRIVYIGNAVISTTMHIYGKLTQPPFENNKSLYLQIEDVSKKPIGIRINSLTGDILKFE